MACVRKYITEPVNPATVIEMDRETVERVARIAHLKLTEEELEGYSRDLSEILEYFKVLDEAPGSEEFGFNPVEISDVLREDEPRMETDPADLLRDMRTYEEYVRGPRLT